MNEEERREYRRQYRKNNPEKFRQYSKNNFQKRREYYANKRREFLAKRMKWINDLKNERGCKVCGGKDDLEFHHRDKTTKIMNVSRMVTCLVKMDILLAEIEKCDVLCSKCHDSIHIKERILTEEERIESQKRLKEYMYRKRREYMAALVQWVNNIIQEQGCKICGTKEFLGFYYRDPNETAPNVSKLVNRMKNKNIILDAIKKCDVYCSNCYNTKVRISNNRN
jgi:hypothetical protein